MYLNRIVEGGKRKKFNILKFMSEKNKIKVAIYEHTTKKYKLNSRFFGFGS